MMYPIQLRQETEALTFCRLAQTITREDKQFISGYANCAQNKRESKHDVSVYRQIAQRKHFADALHFIMNHDLPACDRA